jgi:hypothetical protein
MPAEMLELLHLGLVKRSTDAERPHRAVGARLHIWLDRSQKCLHLHLRCQAAAQIQMPSRARRSVRSHLNQKPDSRLTQIKSARGDILSYLKMLE